MAKKQPSNRKTPMNTASGRVRYGHNINVWLRGPLGEALEAWLASKKPRPNKTVAVEFILEKFLTEEGFYQAPDEPSAG